jgi:hypothetical protein
MYSKIISFDVCCFEKVPQTCFKTLGQFFQVLTWQERLDRTCCERLKTIQNPPTMVGMVMLMAMALLEKHEFSSHASGSGTSTRHDRKSFDGSAVTDDTSSSGGPRQKRNRLEAAQSRPPQQPTYAGTGVIEKERGRFEEGSFIDKLVAKGLS